MSTTHAILMYIGYACWAGTYGGGLAVAKLLSVSASEIVRTAIEHLEVLEQVGKEFWKTENVANTEDANRDKKGSGNDRYRARCAV